MSKVSATASVETKSSNAMTRPAFERRGANYWKLSNGQPDSNLATTSYKGFDLTLMFQVGPSGSANLDGPAVFGLSCEIAVCDSCLPVWEPLTALSVVEWLPTGHKCLSCLAKSYGSRVRLSQMFLAVRCLSGRPGGR